jgi:DDE superfamily endonuclease/Tc5 transposase DNA-binding domain/helix-turn-helix, Psq domain
LGQLSFGPARIYPTINSSITNHSTNVAAMSIPREEQLTSAIQSLSTGEFSSIRAAAKAYGVNRNTLTRRMQGGLTQREAQAPNLLLSTEQEDLLVRWILDLERAGHPPNHTQIREFVVLICRASGGPDSVGVNWVPRFLQRNPSVKSKVGRKIESLRIKNTTPEALEEWFEHFRGVQVKYQVRPMNIWNMDETGIALGVCNNQVVVGSSTTDYAYVKSPENREWVSIIETISANGVCIRPLVIFKGQTLQTTWFRPDHVPDWLYTSSMNGWTSNDICLRWLRDIFLPETKPVEANEYRILLVDGHGSHITTDFMYECHQNRVQLVYLLPHSSHVLQPLDLACFSVVKSRYRAQITDLARYEDSAPIKKIRFIQYYDKARSDGLVAYAIRAGWKAAGIYPWDPRKVIRSSQVVQNQCPAPSTPTQQKRKLSISTDIVTPHNRQQFYSSLRSISQQESISRPVRILLQKTGKAIDQFHVQQAVAEQKLSAYEMKISELHQKKRRKIPIDANKLFASIETIKAVQDEQQRHQDEWDSKDRAREARKTANEMIARDITQFQHQFHINSVV